MQNTKAKILELKTAGLLQRFTKNTKLSLVALIFSIIGVVGAIGAISVMIGQNYAKRIEIGNQNIREITSQRAEFAVKKIILKKNGQVYEISDNGLIINYEESLSNIIKNRRLISNQQLASLLRGLTEEEYLALLSGYFTSGEAYTLTIETTHGSKTIIFNDQNPNPPPEDIEDILDEAEEIIEDLDDPQPTPPQINPTPTPSGTPLPTPTPASANPPTPTPTPVSGSVQPFSCDMLQNQINDVTVSNTVCIPEN